jgi:hypothetical protein
MAKPVNANLIKWTSLGWAATVRLMASISVALTLGACAPTLAENQSFGADNGSSANTYDVAGAASLRETPSSREITCEDVLLLTAAPEISAKINTVFGNSAGGYVADGMISGYSDIADRKNRVGYAECDANGAFTLRHVYRGDYYIVARATWLLRWAHRGGYLAKRVSVSGSLTSVRLEK